MSAQESLNNHTEAHWSYLQHKPVHSLCPLLASLPSTHTTSSSSSTRMEYLLFPARGHALATAEVHFHLTDFYLFLKSQFQHSPFKLFVMPRVDALVHHCDLLHCTHGTELPVTLSHSTKIPCRASRIAAFSPWNHEFHSQCLSIQRNSNIYFSISSF